MDNKKAVGQMVTTIAQQHISNSANQPQPTLNWQEGEVR